MILPVSLTIVLTAASSHGPVAAPAPRPALERLGVFDIKTVGIDPGLKQTAIDTIASAIGATKLYQVVSSNEINLMLDAEKKKELSGCDDLSCMSDIVAALGVEMLAGGTITKVDDSLVVSLQLVDNARAETKNRVSLTWPGPQAGLADVIEAATQLLILPAAALVPGGVRVAGLGSQDVVSVDGKTVGAGPVAVDQLAVGIHQLTVRAPGYEAFGTPLVVRMGATTVISPQLQALSKVPPWRRWWFWTAAGAVVLGGAAASVYVATRNNGPSGASFRTTAPGVTP